MKHRARDRGPGPGPVRVLGRNIFRYFVADVWCLVHTQGLVLDVASSTHTLVLRFGLVRLASTDVVAVKVVSLEEPQ